MAGLSLRPSTFSQGGGLIDDVDVEIVRARFVSYDYDGKADKSALCLFALLKDAEGTEHAQYYSAGDLAYFVPSEDPKNEDLNGISVVQVGEKTSLNGGTNAALFLNSLVQAGFPEDKLDSGDIRELEGLVAHVNRVPQPKRSGLPARQGANADRQPMVLLVTSIKTLPGEQAAKGKSKGETAKASGGSAKPSGAPVEELVGEMIGLFASKGVTSMKKVEISRGLFSTIDKANPNKNKLISMASKDDVLKSLEGFSYNGSVLTQEE